LQKSYLEARSADTSTQHTSQAKYSNENYSNIVIFEIYFVIL